MADKVECLVIGAGVVGLAIARALALAGREVVVLEAADAIGTGTSSRNSEVIHAGIYYPAGSLKTRLCVEGRDRLYAYCASHGVAHRRTGKLIVATEASELATLDGLSAAAAANGVILDVLDATAARTLEPALRTAGALHSPLTGIVDSHGLMLAYQGEAEANSAMVAFNTAFKRAQPLPGGGFRVWAGETVLDCAVLINSSGLGAQTVAGAIDGLPAGAIPPLHLVKGNYFTLPGKPAFSRLIYPVPAKAGLGVHLTLDLAGQMRFGPDTEYVESLDYRVDPARAEVFYAAIRRYWPGLPDGTLQPAYSGIRPKLQGPQDGFRDFVINASLPGLVNLFGIESPGLTASLAIADHVADLVRG